MASVARKYAEKELGVHAVFKEANDANLNMVDEQVKLSDMRALRRELTEDILDREARILHEVRNTHPELSATAHEQKARLERRTDQKLVDLRRFLQVAQKNEDNIEHAIKFLQNRINIATARMIELGGYLPYLTKVWEQDAVAKSNTPQGSEQA